MDLTPPYLPPSHQAVVSCMDVPEVPEKLVLDMGSNAYRQNQMYMIDKVGDRRAGCSY